MSIPSIVWVTLLKERYADHTVFVFTTQKKAEAFARATAQKNAGSDQESISEIVCDVVRTGWSLYIRYSEVCTLIVMRCEVQGDIL